MSEPIDKLADETVKKLETIVGRANIITREDLMANYAVDEMPNAKPQFPQVVVKPADAVSVARVLKLANAQGIPVVARGAGTGLNAGAIATHGGIVLSLERMTRILEIDRENFVAVVEPGVTVAEVCRRAEEAGLYYPLYPGELSATIGGNIATNAGGMNAVKYGVTRHNVLGLEAVLPNGEIIKTGGKFVKCSSGYDLTQLIIGSEGTLAVVTQVILKLTTKPTKREILFAPFPDLQNAIDAVPEILRLKMVPTGIEFMERQIIEIAEKYLGRKLPYDQYEAFLLVIMDGESEDDIFQYFTEVEDVCKKHGAVETLVPDNEMARKNLLESREKFYHAIKQFAPLELIDVVVPRSAIAKFIKQVKDLSAKYEIPVVAYGHAGDGNVHLHPLCVNMNDETWQSRLPQLMAEIYHAGVSFGGAISGEHGIGLQKKSYFTKETDPALLQAMKGVKRAFDPKNILNPGKILDL